MTNALSNKGALEYCGYLAKPGPHEAREEVPTWQPKNWQECATGYRCVRDVWQDGRCLWHADSDNKDRSHLRDSRTDEAERLDGAILRDMDLSGSEMFSECSLQCAMLENVTLDRADFQRALLWNCTFAGNVSASNADFRKADIRNANIENIEQLNFNGADFSEANLTEIFEQSNLAEFSDSILFAGADFEAATMSLGNFCGCDLHRANLTMINAEGASFCKASLESADLIRADLRRADFSDARLFHAFISDVRINEKTIFDQHCIYERNPKEKPSYIDQEDVHPYEAAAWVYRRLQSVCNSNAISSQAREYHVRKREAERKLAYQENRPIDVCLSEIDRIFTRHGERPRRVLGWWLFIIVFSSVVYAFVGIVEDSIIYRICATGDASVSDPLTVFGQSLYFSIAVFSTGGFGDVVPAGGLAKTTASVEAVLGALFIALFVFTLGRRVDW